MVEHNICPYYKYGQCTVVPPKLAYAVVSASRCRKYWKTCRYYRKKLGLNNEKESRNEPKQRNIPLTSFLGRIEHEIVITTDVKKMNSEGKKILERKMSKVFQMLLTETKEKKEVS
ncbi:MAG: hypothetical protein DRO23_02260 [Thermoprotei archaeon]|nr:MAG: hypothetical protein DRO23_02260 [Thermoprotei archaeon]